MNEWYEPSLRDDFYDPYYYDDEHECEFSHQVRKYESAREWVEELIHHIYNTGSIEGIENALDELTGAWGIQLPKSKPKIIKKPNELFDFAVQLSKAPYINLT